MMKIRRPAFRSHTVSARGRSDVLLTMKLGKKNAGNAKYRLGGMPIAITMAANFHSPSARKSAEPSPNAKST